MRCLMFLLALIFSLPAFAAGLNDTGIIVCGDAANNNVDCSSSDPAGYPRQDGRFGRAAMDAAGVLYKVGASSSYGFDFTKLANNQTELAAAAALGSGTSDWACTRDNVTGLVWEVKTDDAGLRDKDNTYTWYSTDNTSNGGNSGTANGGTCAGSNCDTESYVAAVNAAQLCGYSDWRMPHQDELLSLLDQSKQWSGQATIDSSYFPNTRTGSYWSDNYAYEPSGAWVVNFYNSNGYVGDKAAEPSNVRLVRGG